MKKFPAAIYLILCSVIYCRAGLFDKSNNALNTFSQTNSVESEAGQNANVSPQNVKAYKTLKFGDDTKIVKQKLDEIVVDATDKYDKSGISLTASENEALESSLFDSEAEFEASKSPYTLYDLMSYLNDTGVSDAVHYKNSAISVDCYQLNKSWNEEKSGDLAIVEVSYITFDLDKLVDGFMQNYPNARKEKKSYKIESEKYPGIFLEFERAYLSDINSDRRAKLSIPTETFAFSFTDLSKLSKEQLAIWDASRKAAIVQDGKIPEMEEYFESVKTSIFELEKSMKSDKKLDDYSLTLLGLGGGGNGDIIYGAPSAIFASKQILDPLMNNYRQSIDAANNTEKAKLKKESDSSSGF